MPRINIPPVTRVLLISLLLLSTLNAAIQFRSGSRDVVVSWLTLVPGLSLFYPWTFATTTLVESNIVGLAIAALVLYHGGRYLERAWSSRELAKFLLVVSLVPNTLAFLTLAILSSLSQSSSWTLTSVAGTVPLQISFLVAFSQLIPAHTVTLFRGVLSMRVPRFPLLYVGLIIILALTPVMNIASCFLVIYGMLTSWTYLRFFKTVFPDLDTSQPTSMRGDASETFAFAEFFPGPAKPVVAAISDQIFNILISMRICSPLSPGNMPSAQGTSYSQRHAPGGVRAEAERRRALALKALDQRLHAASASNSRAQPQPANHTSGPAIQTQPRPDAQTAMTSEPGSLLGETHYNPDSDPMERSDS